MIGERISHYRIEDQLGRGGMGVVYRARDLRLDRSVAIKLLPPDVDLEGEEQIRFVQEAQAASALEHKNIATIHEIDSTPDGRSFIVMGYYPGLSLRERLDRDGALPLAEAVELAAQMAEGLHAAHQRGIVHRDVKPANVMLAEDGQAKLVDFGIAKLAGGARVTRTGGTVGTLSYMSPEQARGEDVDARADVFSVGCVLYEMLSGRRPFDAGSDAARLHKVLNEDPEPLGREQPDVPSELAAVVERALAKDRDRRIASAGELVEALRPWRGGQSASEPTAPMAGLWRRPGVLAGLGLVVVVAGWFGYGAWQRVAERAWARQEAIPEVARLVEERRFLEALALARRADRVIPDDPTLDQLMDRATVEIPVQTDPPGARVLYKRYLEPESDWVLAGVSPMEAHPFPREYLRIRVEAEGFEPLELGGLTRYAGLNLSLRPSGEEPTDMVRVDGQTGTPVVPPVPVPPFWIGTHEVTNEEFQAFVDAGGYGDGEWWSDVRTVAGTDSLASLLDRFRDRTGRPGPAGWRLGHPPEGEARHPVRGISWYEAGAYCRWAGGSLPTLYHWSLAAAPMGDVWAEIIRVSNFGRSGTRPVGSTGSLGPYGTQDMPGNVAEWVWNASQDGGRYALGGSWNDPEYAFQQNLAADPLARSDEIGVRCARYDAPPAPVLREPVPLPVYDFRGVEAVDDSTYATFEELFAFDPSPLDPRPESVEEALDWRRETVTIAAAYGEERFRVHLFLPRDVAPPWQPVVVFPGGTARALPSSFDLADLDIVDFIPRTGRALVYPVYSGTYERRSPDAAGAMEQIARMVRQQQDLIRTVDYLATREDLDVDRLGYVGLSAGGEYGPIRLALEDRIRAAVFLGGGYDASHMQYERPELNPWNYAPRVTTPVLMLNGEYDWGIPVETGQVPMFEMLGTPEEDKHHLWVEGGHVPPQDFVVRETLDWFDRYLGPVR